MARCKEFIQSDDTAVVPELVVIRRCSRTATKGFPYCWQHCEYAREAAEALNTSDDLNTAMLQYLTCQGKEYRSRKRQICTVPAAGALTTLEKIHNKPGPSLGDLDLPFEIVRMIISGLSFLDLRSFKATNSRAREMVIFNPEYRNIVTYAPETVAILDKTDLLASFSIDDIHDALTRSRCKICDRRGGFVFFPSFQRCCERCARYDDAFVPISLSTVTREFGIFGGKLPRHLPKMLVTPQILHRGSPWPQGDSPPQPLRLVSRAQAIDRAKASVRDKPSKALLKFNARTSLLFSYRDWAMTVYTMPSLNQKTQTAIPAYQCKGCARAQCENSGTRRVSTTTSCPGCQYSLSDGIDVPSRHGEAWQSPQGKRSCRVVVARGRQYTEEEMLEHFAECGEVQAMMADLAEELERPIPTTEEVARKRRAAQRAKQRR